MPRITSAASEIGTSSPGRGAHHQLLDVKGLRRSAAGRRTSTLTSSRPALDPQRLGAVEGAPHLAGQIRGGEAEAAGRVLDAEVQLHLAGRVAVVTSRTPA